MQKNIAVLGEDKRMDYVFSIMKQHFNADRTLENKKYDYIVLPLIYDENKPQTDDIISHLKGDGKIFLGKISENFKKTLEKNKIIWYDYYVESMIIQNAAATAEGAVKVLIENTPFTIRNSKILITGCGRIAKYLAHLLKSMGADVYVSTRDKIKMVWLEVFGFKTVASEKISDVICEFDSVINTSPKMIIDMPQISKISQKDKYICLIELAGKNKGINADYAEMLNIPVVCAAALPPICLS
jgi:dipicolinate synthase subunit A